MARINKGSGERRSSVNTISQFVHREDSRLSVYRLALQSAKTLHGLIKTTSSPFRSKDAAKWHNANKQGRGGAHGNNDHKGFLRVNAG